MEMVRWEGDRTCAHRAAAAGRRWEAGRRRHHGAGGGGGGGGMAHDSRHAGRVQA